MLFHSLVVYTCSMTSASYMPSEVTVEDMICFYINPFLICLLECIIRVKLLDELVNYLSLKDKNPVIPTLLPFYTSDSD